MAGKPWETDEDKMIERLIVHRECITWTMNALEAEGIACERTTGNDRNGDILCVRAEDTPKAQEIIRKINSKYNP